MGVFTQHIAVCYQGKEIRHYGTAIFKGIAHRMLHKGIGHQYPESRQIRADGDNPDAGTMGLLGQLIPAEHPEPQEGGLQEEGRQGLQRQRSAEDIPHKAGIFGPVHAEVEFLHDARDNAHGKVNQKERAKEFNQLFAEGLPFRSVRPYITSLEQRHEDGEPQGYGHEQEMVDSGDGELPS